jgi:uncharacterized membrane protein
MYFLDPRLGRRRRALLGDRLAHARRVGARVARIAGGDLGHRIRGLLAESRRLLGNGEAADAKVTGRVRARIGRVVSHPHAVRLAVQNGRVVLSGPILTREVAPLLRSLRHVQGVREVEDRLTAYEKPGNISALQGGQPRRGERLDVLQEKWAPSTRVLAGGLGGALLIHGLRGGGALGLLSALAGGAMALRAATNRRASSLVGMGDGTDGFQAQKTVHVAATVDEVFNFWADFTNFPRFMSRVREVRMLDEQRSRWTVAGPAGLPTHWTASVVRVEPGSLIEWCTEAGSAVRHSGTVRFEANDNGGTRVHVRLSYLPPAGVLGHAVASLLGADPKSEMDQDLMRMKTALETGRAPHDAARRLPHSVAGTLLGAKGRSAA